MFIMTMIGIGIIIGEVSCIVLQAIKNKKVKGS
jgi:hypothetical protein